MKKSAITKILAMLLIVVMIFGCLPLSSMALEDWEGNPDFSEPVVDIDDLPVHSYVTNTDQTGNAAFTFAVPEPEQGKFVWEDLSCEIQNGSIVIADYTGTESELTIPDTIKGYPVKEIYDWAFSNCSRIDYLEIPACITAVGDRAFMNVSTIKFLGDVPDLVWSYTYGPDIMCDIHWSSNCGCNGVETGGTFYGFSGTIMISEEYPGWQDVIEDNEGYSDRAIVWQTYTSAPEEPEPGETEPDLFLPEALLNVDEKHITRYAADCFRGNYNDPEAYTGKALYAPHSQLGEDILICWSYTYSAWEGSIDRIPWTMIPAADVRTNAGYQFYRYAIDVPADIYTCEIFSIHYGALTCENNQLKEDLVSYGGKTVDLYISVKIVGDDTNAEVYMDQMILADHCEEYASKDGTVCTKCGASLGTTEPGGAVWEGLQYEIKNNEATVTGYTGTATELVIPDTIEGYPVTGIEEWAFSDCDNLTGVTIPGSITDIGAYAFAYCYSLKDITFKGDAPAIGADALEFVVAAAYYPMGNGTWTAAVRQNYGGSIKWFSYEEEPEEMVWGDFLYIICDNEVAITGYTGTAANLIIPNAIGNYPVTGIEEWAFSDCDNLTGVTIPASITDIGAYAFAYCYSLKDITFKGDAPVIGSDALELVVAAAYYPMGNATWTAAVRQNYGGSIKWFSYEEEPEEMVWGDFLYIICDNEVAITGYTGTAANLIIPNAIENYPVTGIEEWAFSDCDNLTGVTIPGSITDIGAYAFAYCYSLKDITFKGDAPAISADALELVVATAHYPMGNATWKTAVRQNYGGSITWSAYDVFVPEGLQFEIKNREVTITGYTGTAAELIIPDTIEGYPVTGIGASAFNNCTVLTGVTIPDSVTCIGAGAFADCTGLQYSVYDNGKYLGSDNNPYAFLMDTTSDSITSCEIHPRTKVINHSAFSGCTGLTSITIPDSVTGIESSAFGGCTGLTSIMISDSVTGIGNSVFEGCTDLVSITIPDSVTNIGSYAFKDCTGLISVILGDSVAAIAVNAFDGCSSLTGIRVDSDNPKYSSNSYGILFDKGKTTLIKAPAAIKNCTIPNSVTGIGEGAFSGCSRLTDITIANGVISIGSSAFENCTGLTSVTVPDSVTSIGEGAFSGCSGLETMTVPFAGGRDGDAFFGTEYAFGYIFGTSSYSGGVATQQRYFDYFLFETFYETYYIPGSLKTVTVTGEIRDYAFENCSGITDITIADSAANISAYGFYGMSGLNGIWVDKENPNYSSDSYGVLLNKDKTAIIKVPVTVTEYTIADTVTEIGHSAFLGCTGLTSITIAGGVTSIDAYAFSGCTGLTEITFKGNAPVFGSDVFYDVAATAYYPFGYASWTENAMQNYGGSITWTVVGPILDGTLKFAQKALSFQDYIGINFVVKAASYDYDSFYIEAVQSTPDGDVTEILEGTASGNNIVFVKQVLSWSMTESVTATLYGVKDGVVHQGEIFSKSVELAALDMIAFYSQNENYHIYCNVLVDMLNYGAEVQKAFGHNAQNLPDRNLGEYASFATGETPALSGVNTSTSVGSVAIRATSISAQSKVEIQFVFKKADLQENYELRSTINGVTTTAYPVDLSGSGSNVVIRVPVKAADMRAVHTIGLYNADTNEPVSAVHTITIEAFALSNVEKETAYKDLVIAMMKYGDAVAAL